MFNLAEKKTKQLEAKTKTMSSFCFVFMEMKELHQFYVIVRKSTSPSLAEDIRWVEVD